MQDVMAMFKSLSWLHSRIGIIYADQEGVDARRDGYVQDALE